MIDEESSEYTQWVQLANDPSQSEEARQRYRALMEAYIHEKLREAFRLAADQTPPKA
jgi:flagellar biosynthesis protein FliP